MMRAAVVVLGALAAVIAIKVNSIYALFILCGDFVYVVAFPQLTCVIYLKFANTYGALAGYFVSFFFRLTAGEPLLNFDPLIKYWYYDETLKTQCFPIRTFAMLLGLLSIILVSALTDKYLPEKFDCLNAIYRKNEESGDVGKIPQLGDHVWDRNEKEIESKSGKVGNGSDNPAFVNESNGVQTVIKATSL